MKFFKPALALFSILALIIFVFLIVKLFDRGGIEYTDEVEQTLPQLLNIDPMVGATGPQVVLVHYANFSCEQCESTAKMLRSIVEDYPEQVILVWKDFPNDSLNPESTPAASAARCAQKQHHFWNYHDLLLSHQNELGDALYEAIALELDLNMWRFNRCVRKDSELDRVLESAQDADNLNLTAAPTIYVNGISYTGDVSETELRSTINQLLVQ
jgi:protein-disulfide isomerase